MLFSVLSLGCAKKVTKFEPENLQCPKRLDVSEWVFEAYIDGELSYCMTDIGYEAFRIKLESYMDQCEVTCKLDN